MIRITETYIKDNGKKGSKWQKVVGFKENCENHTLIGEEPLHFTGSAVMTSDKGTNFMVLEKIPEGY